MQNSHKDDFEETFETFEGEETVKKVEEDENCVEHFEENAITSPKHYNPETKPSKKAVTVKLEASLSEKLGRKREEADKLDEEHKILKSKFQDELKSVDCIKEYLDEKGEKLLQSLELFGNYMRKIQKLKQDANEMHEEIKSEYETKTVKLDKQEREYHKLLVKEKQMLNVLQKIEQSKGQLENIVSDLPQFQNAKKLVEYFLVLKLLREDLLDDIEKYHEKEKKISQERQMIVRSIKRHPLKVLEKENVIYSLTYKINEVQNSTAELDQQLDNITSVNMQEHMAWYETKRWIKDLYKFVRDKLHTEPDEVTDFEETLDQLDTIKDFILKGKKAAEKLKQ